MNPPASSAPGAVLLAGATGLVGGLCLDELLRRDQSDVTAVVRRPLAIKHPRLRTLVSDLNMLDSVRAVESAAALSAVGTTIKKAGSPEAFRAVDRDAVVSYARWARTGGADVFVLVSSVGAAADASNFYLRVKGEAEEAVAALGWRRLVILRPSLLLGPRAERRPGEAIAQSVLPLLQPLLRGGLRRYRAVEARTVARAMLAAISGPPGRYLWEHAELTAAGA